jgi:hypothetical protein
MDCQLSHFVLISAAFTLNQALSRRDQLGSPVER